MAMAIYTAYFNYACSTEQLVVAKHLSHNAVLCNSYNIDKGQQRIYTKQLNYFMLQ